MLLVRQARHIVERLANRAHRNAAGQGQGRRRAVHAHHAAGAFEDVIEVPACAWAVFRSSGAYPSALQATWAATATEWFPSNPWRLRPGPSIVAVLERADDFTTATTELWMPIERAS